MANKELLEYLFSTEDGAALIAKSLEDYEEETINLVDASKNMISSIAYDSFTNSYKGLLDADTGMSSQDLCKLAIESACTTFMIYGFIVKEQLTRLELEKLMNA